MGTFKTSYRRLGQDRASPSPALLDLALCLHSSDRPSVSDVGIGVGFRFGFSFGLGFGIHSMVAWVRPSSRRHSLLHAPRLRPCHRARSTCTVQGRAVEILVTDRQTDRTDRPYRPTDRPTDRPTVLRGTRGALRARVIIVSESEDRPTCLWLCACVSPSGRNRFREFYLEPDLPTTDLARCDWPSANILLKFRVQVLSTLRDLDPRAPTRRLGLGPVRTGTPGGW